MSTVTRKKPKRFPIRYLFVAIWVIFTLSLSVWWYVFSQRQVARLMVIDSSATAKLVADQRMLMWEGAVLIASLLCGGGALAFLVYRDARNAKQMKDFFLTFSHELKTPLANMRLTAESLLEDLGESPYKNRLEELVSQTDRMHAQVENSLSLVEVEGLQLAKEKMQLGEIIRMLHNEFPSLELVLKRDCSIEGDVQAVTTILRNLVRNACVHGQAARVWFSPSDANDKKVRVEVKDDGIGIQGAAEELGKPFRKIYSGSGSGLGLFISKRLAERMGGTLQIVSVDNGFSLEFYLPGRIG